MPLIRAALVLLTLPSLAAGAAETCPLGRHDDHLTVHAVMQNFGRFTLKADKLALAYTMPSPTFTDADLTAAIADLKVAQACADAVLANPAGDLLPDDANFLTGAKRDKLIIDYLSYLTEFRDELFYFQREIERVLADRPGSRTLKEVYTESREVESLADHAHAAMGGDSSGRACPRN